MLKSAIISVIILLAAVINIAAQGSSYVGLPKEEVKQQMKMNYRDFAEDRSIIKQQFNYLKYINGSQTVTWIFYFTDEDICRSSKKVCDYSEYDFVLDELEEKYEKTGDMVWEYTADSITYSISIEERDWYFTVREAVKEE